MFQGFSKKVKNGGACSADRKRNILVLVRIFFSLDKFKYKVEKVN